MILGQDFDGFVGTLEDVTKERVLLAMTELVPQYADVPAPTTGPPDNFAATIWPGLVEAMASEGYYLSMDELLLVSELAQQNVAIFQVQREPERLVYRCGNARHDGALTLLSLDCGRGDRGHYERLLKTADVQSLQDEVDAEELLRLAMRREEEERREAERRQKELLREEERRRLKRELDAMSAEDLHEQRLLLAKEAKEQAAKAEATARERETAAMTKEDRVPEEKDSSTEEEDETELGDHLDA